MSRPLFTIGVTTYNRPELLKQCLETILAQEFRDFEVIIGNDYVSKPLSKNILGFQDPRIRILNYGHNLGELGNLNALLAAARGEYFTWQADDDYYDPKFLADVRTVLIGTDSLQAVYTSYYTVREHGVMTHPVFKVSRPASTRVLNGRQLLNKYWRHSIRIMGLTGVYRTDYLRRIGGVVNLGNCRIAIMSEWLLLIQSGLLKKVAYLKRPLVYYRVHPESWSATSADGKSYAIAGLNMLRRSMPIFQDLRLHVDFEFNLTGLLKLILIAVAKFSARPGGGFSSRKMLAYHKILEDECRQLVNKSCRYGAEISIRKAKLYLYKILPGIMLYSRLPRGIFVAAKRIRGIVTGEITGRMR